MPNHLLSFASETYLIAVKDLTELENSPTYQPDKNEVIILVGNTESNQDDTLFAGRHLLQTSAKYLEVKIAYPDRPKFFNFFINLIKPLKRRYYSTGSRYYHTPLDTLLSKQIHRGIRTAANAYKWTNKRWALPEEERVKRYQELYQSLKTHGYDDNSPLLILLNRNLGVKDQLLQGHHRIGICKELNINDVTVKFWTAPQSPFWVKHIYNFISIIKGLK